MDAGDPAGAGPVGTGPYGPEAAAAVPAAAAAAAVPGPAAGLACPGPPTPGCPAPGEPGRPGPATTGPAAPGPGGGGPTTARPDRGANWRAPSATTSSGCSIAVGAVPNPRCRSVAASGMRLDPPTRKTADSCGGVRPAAATASSVAVTVRSRIGRASCSSCSRPSGTLSSTSGTCTYVVAARLSVSLACRASSHSCQAARRSESSAGWESRRHSSGARPASSRPR